MGYSACPLCGEQENEICFEERSYKLLACKRCDLFFIHPYPHENDVHQHVLKYDYDNLEIIDASKFYSASKLYFQKYFHAIEKECLTAKSILDVGCGTGNLLELLGSNSDIHRVGIELNAQRAEFATQVANCKVFQMPLENFTYHSKFDIIIMINVLSHISSFDNLFSSIQRLLADNGKLILKVGEMTKNIKSSAINDWGIPDHLHFLGMDTMKFICDKYGYKIIRHDRQPFSADLFSRNTWEAPGRSPARNVIKRIVARTPFALSMLASLYNLRYGDNMFSSFIVISPQS